MSRDRQLTRPLFLVASLILTLVSSFLFVFVASGSQEIAVAISLLASSLPWLIIKAKRKRERTQREALWPEVIESVISALHSGRSISEALIDLQEFGPDAMAPFWRRIASRISAGEPLERIFENASAELQSPRADQFFATMLFAKNFGGNSVQISLRYLSSFIRDDIQMHDEISTRFGWIQNSAALAACAPWLLLLLLAAQPGTVQAYGSTPGKVVLSIGVLATVIAYAWMAKISRINEQPRVFELREVSSRED